MLQSDFLACYQCFDINLTSVVIMEVNMNATHLCINSEVAADKIIII